MGALVLAPVQIVDGLIHPIGQVRYRPLSAYATHDNVVDYYDFVLFFQQKKLSIQVIGLIVKKSFYFC